MNFIYHLFNCVRGQNLLDKFNLSYLASHRFCARPEKINSFSESTDMYEVTTTYKEIIKTYEKLLNNIEFNKVENMEIMQPEDSVNGDKYVILLRKMDGDEVISEDVQILTCKRVEDEGVDKVVTQKEVEKAVKLPVTGDNIFLIGGFAALVVTLIVLVVLKKKSTKNA